MMGMNPDTFATTYSKNASGTVVYDFDLSVTFPPLSYNWQCYTGNNKGFPWYGGSIYGAYRCWEGSVCYTNLISTGKGVSC